MDREIEVECPSCSPTNKVSHEVVSNREKRIIRCSKCSTTRQIEFDRHPASVKLKVVVSYHDKSYVQSFEAGTREVLRVDDEIIAENESAEAVRITAIEFLDGSRHREAQAALVSTIWAQKIDKVVVKIAVHRGRTTRSYSVVVEGDREFGIGDLERGGVISRIKIKNGPILARVGQAAQAKDIQRIYVNANKRGKTRKGLSHDKEA